MSQETQSEAKSSVFDKDFTNRYQLSKTLRFRLKPTPETQALLDENGITDQDKVRYEKYKIIRPFLDRLHREFITEALKDFQFTDLDAYKTALAAHLKNKKDAASKKILKDRSKHLREEIVECFDATAKTWANQYENLEFKKNDLDILFSEKVFDILSARYGGDSDTLIKDESTGQEISIFSEWNGFTGYFTKFHETRKNFYKADGTSTAIATRIIDGNLQRFYTNIRIFSIAAAKGVDFSPAEINLGVDCEQIFTLGYYQQCLLQQGIDEYNAVLGGVLQTDGVKIQGLNELINQHNQIHNDAQKLDLLKPLEKQILGDTESTFFAGIQTQEELIETLHKFRKTAETKTQLIKHLVHTLATDSDQFELPKVYLSKEAFNTIAWRWTKPDTKSVLEKALYTTLRTARISAAKDKGDGEYEFPPFISLHYIKTALEAELPTQRVWKDHYYHRTDENVVNTHFAITGDEPIWQAFLQILVFEFDALFEQPTPEGRVIGYTTYRQDIDALLTTLAANPDHIIGRNERIIVKNFADTVLHIHQMASYFAVEKKRTWVDDVELCLQFYGTPTIHGYLVYYQDTYASIVKTYNHLRNYLTKKPFNDEKWKLNFENPTLANGWDKNKEPDNTAIILRKAGQYYLAIMDKKHRNLFATISAGEQDNQGFYEKMVYKYFPDTSRMIPKCSTQVKKVKAHFATSSDDYELFDKKTFAHKLRISKEIYEVNNIYYRKDNIHTAFIPKNENEKKIGVKSFQKAYLINGGNEDRHRKSLRNWIDFCKSFLLAYKSTSIFDYSELRASNAYRSLDEFYDDINKLTYSVTFPHDARVSIKSIDTKVRAGELYLFAIHNKDWNLKDGKQKTGTKNLQTLYFESLFSVSNTRDRFMQLNGEAELFFRPKTPLEKLGTKKDRQDKKVIDRKRYANDTLLFHCPITLNRGKGKGESKSFNDSVNTLLAQNPSINILGIDRGEKHLAYYSLIRQDGTIVPGAIGTLNTINGINYADTLHKRAKAREQDRKDWQDIEAIKDMKKGYVSQVVRTITDLALEHNAIIVLEDLNVPFKQTRSAIEKSIYQQLEKALIDKLSFVVDKTTTDPAQAGHVLKARQLTAPFTSFKDMGKQTGIVFYTAAGYTSKTCPAPGCGFHRNVKFQFQTIPKAKETIQKLDDFYYQNGHFVIAYTVSKFSNQPKEKHKTNELYANVHSRDVFTLTSNAIRYKWLNKNSPQAKLVRQGEQSIDTEAEEQQTKRGITKSYDITACLVRLFSDHGIDYKAAELKHIIASTDLGAAFYRDLLYYLYLLTETRQTVSGTAIDAIHCPACGFDSSKGFQGNEFNGDANGAYNIARKGAMILQKIKQFAQNNGGDISKMHWGDLTISTNEWDKFAAGEYKKKN